MRVEDAHDSIFKQVPIYALAGWEHRARISKVEVVIREETKNDGRERVDSVLAVAGHVNLRERMLYIDNGCVYGCGRGRMSDSRYMRPQ